MFNIFRKLYVTHVAKQLDIPKTPKVYPVVPRDEQGRWHKLNGPIGVWSNGVAEYWIHGEKVTKEQHKLYVDLLKLKKLRDNG